MLFYVIELETTTHYISILISLLFYSWVIIRHESIFLYLYPLRIKKTSDPCSYSSSICFKFLFGNICIRFRIRFLNMKMYMKRALSDPHPIRFHPYLFSG
jgi:hypothetical protein